MTRPKIVIKGKSSESTKKADTSESKVAPASPQIDTSASTKINESMDFVEKTTQAPQPRKRKWWIYIVAGVLAILAILASLYFFTPFFNSDKSNLNEEQILTESVENASKYETRFDDFEKEILGQTKSFSELLNDIGIAGADINSLKKAARTNSLSTLRKGDKFAVYLNDEVPQLIVIEPKSNPYNKFEVNLEELSIQKVEKQREIRVQEMAAIVETNLGITFINNNLNLKLISKLEEIFQYSVDLFQVDDGDRFKILYDQEFLDGKPYSIRGIRAAFIQEGSQKYYAFMRKEGREVIYYNDFGESMKRSFLSSPIKYGGVVTSGFGLRVHPKLGYRKMHLGTDYAAAEGTPILAVADGVVTGRAFAGDNGNFIKIKHDDDFETQYLHMQKFESDVKLGSRVSQGDVIGYVGMTGLATGPHVCFRFKKNGQQVNPADYNSGTSGRIPSTDLADYRNSIIPLQKAIKKIEYF